MLVSVVMPARNAASTIAGQLAALAAQADPPDWELVVVDDGSSDATAAVVGATPRARTIVAGAAGAPGAAGARNAGARASRGQVLAFCDADDVVAPDWLATLTAAVLAGHDVVGGAIDLRALDPGAPRWQEWALRRPHTWRGRPFAVSANMALRRDVFDAVGGFDEEIVRGEDVDLSLRLAEAGYEIYFERQAVVAKRPRSSVGGVWRQAYQWGVADHLLAARHPEISGRHRGTAPTVATGPVTAARPAAAPGRPGGYGRTVVAAAGRVAGRAQGRFLETSASRP